MPFDVSGDAVQIRKKREPPHADKLKLIPEERQVGSIENDATNLNRWTLTFGRKLLDRLGGMAMDGKGSLLGHNSDVGPGRKNGDRVLVLGKLRFFNGVGQVMLGPGPAGIEHDVCTAGVAIQGAGIDQPYRGRRVVEDRLHPANPQVFVH